MRNIYSLIFYFLFSESILGFKLEFGLGLDMG